MRLTLIIADLTRGGAQRVLSDLANSWAQRGHNVTLVTCDATQPPAYDLCRAVNLVRLGLGGVSNNPLQGLARNLHRATVLRRTIRASRPDLVISFIEMTNIIAILATVGLPTPLIISERCPPLVELGWIWSTLRRLLYRFADVLVCETDKTVQRFRAISRVPAVAITNGLNLPSVPRLITEKTLRERGYTLIGMGRLAPEKGFDLLISAFAKVAPSHHDWTLAIYGDGPLLQELQAQAASLHISERVYFGGVVTDPFVRFAAADLFALSSRYEGSGMALLEAMGCGLAAVSFDCPEGPREIIRNGVDGILVPPEDVFALAAALDRLMGDSSERQRLAARALEVRERFSMEKALFQWQRLFNELLPNAHVQTQSMKVTGE